MYLVRFQVNFNPVASVFPNPEPCSVQICRLGNEDPQEIQSDSLIFDDSSISNSKKWPYLSEVGLEISSLWILICIFFLEFMPSARIPPLWRILKFCYVKQHAARLLFVLQLHCKWDEHALTSFNYKPIIPPFLPIQVLLPLKTN